jgi:16S rRNA processing protein RimM
MIKSDRVILGKVVSTHGIHGWLSILCFAHPPQNLTNYDTSIVFNDSERKINITDVKIMPKKVIIKIEGYDSIDLSESILGKDIFIDKSEIPTLIEGEYYWRDLEGLEVFTSKEKYLGIIDFIFNNGSNDVLAIKYKDKYSYIALLKDNITSISNKKIIIKHESV